MGLDNGFIVRNINKKEVPSFVVPMFENGEETTLEVCYWRKCWGLRGEINSFLHLPYSEYQCNVDLEDLKGILKILKNYLNPQYWQENHNSIWEWEDYFDCMLQQYMNLFWLQSYWANHPELEVIWYDSY